MVHDFSRGSRSLVGTSEYAEAAGFAVVVEIAEEHGYAPIYAFTLMKVIGRDIWIGLWAFIRSIVAVTFWEKSEAGQRIRAGVIWERFPKFVLFSLRLLMSLFAASGSKDHMCKAKLKEQFKNEVGQTISYEGDFTDYFVPPDLAKKFHMMQKRT